MRRLFPLLLILAIALLPLGVAHAEMPYKAEIRLEGLKDSALSRTLRDSSQLVQLENRPPPSAAALRRRAEDDTPRLTDIMHAAGYWQAQIATVYDFDAQPAKLTVTVTPGPLFHLAKVDFRTPTGETPPLLARLGPAPFGLIIGGPARSAPVTAAEAQITEEFARNGQPLAKVTDRHVVIDVATDGMSVTYTVEPGPAARFGSTAIAGLRNVNGDFVGAHIAWREGDPYDSRLVETTRQDLVKSSLFSGVRISHGEAPDARDEVPMTVDLTEGPAHSVGAGVGYNTNLGLGGQTFWQDRNLFGGGESLRITAGAAQRQLGLALEFRKPDFVDTKQSFLTNAQLLRQTTDAYRSLREQVFVGIERPLIPSLTADAGFSIEHANVQSNIFPNEDYTLFGLPFFLRHDATDDLLDPTIGDRQTLTLVPYRSLTGPDLTFLSTRVEERHYQRLDDSGRMVLAGFAAFGAIAGASRDAVPPDKRLYAGGSGSVRGYGYQRAGPLGAGDVPLGGISSVELGLEFRYRITDTIGLAPFVEGGNVYPHSFPNSVKLFYGGGLGFRYYTTIGPIRLDLATPFERRPGDAVIQFYISIGQAF